MSSPRIHTRVVLTSLFAGALVAGMFAACAEQPERSAGPSLQQPSSLTAAMRVQERYTPDLLDKPGIVGTAVGIGNDGRPTVVVMTRAPGVTGIPATLEGTRVEVRVTGEFHALSLAVQAGTNLKGQIRPVPNGVSVGNNNECAAGTLGAAVYIGGNQYVLSNNHVLARENAAAIGEYIVQPGRYDNKPKCANEVATDQIADLSDFQAIVFSTSANNTMDAAVAQATTTLTCATPAGFYGSPSTTAAPPSVGLAIQKVGRTSRLTTGTITAVNATVNVGYSSGTARFVGQIVTSRGQSKAGDSGSLFVTNDGTNRPVGLLFAGTSDGTTIANPIGLVLSRFGATICQG